MNQKNGNAFNKIIQKQKIKINNITNLKKIYKKENNDIEKNDPTINNKTFCFKQYKNDLNITNISNNNDFSSQMGTSPINNISPDLDWNNYESIYNHLVSYINLMIINLKKDNNKLCKYLKEIFFAIFSISQKTKNFYKTIKTSSKNSNNTDKNIKDNNHIKKTNNSTTNNGDWNFITGEITSNNNNYLIEDLYEKEKKKKEQGDKENKEKINSSFININKIKKPLTQRFEKSKSEKELEMSFLQEKFEKLNKKFKKKEKEFQIDKLKYLFRINEQNKLIKNLENKMKLNFIEKKINNIKCFPDLLNENNEDNSIRSCLDLNISNKRKTFYLSHPKLNFKDNSINGKNCHNIEDIINKNLFKLRNKGKIHKNNLKKFISLSLSETKMQVDKILNIK